MSWASYHIAKLQNGETVQFRPSGNSMRPLNIGSWSRWERPTTTIAAAYGVSDQAVSKWCKKYGLKKPGPGYWSKQAAIKAKGQV